MISQMLTSLEIAQEAVKVLDAKKAMDIKMLKTHDITVLADYFIICTASSTTHVKALSDEVEKNLKEKGEPPLRTEGYRSGGWILVDFGCVVIHIFLDETRKFYNLEHLWGDAPVVDIKEFLTED
jgi:ribosome-associated protein